MQNFKFYFFRNLKNRNSENLKFNQKRVPSPKNPHIFCVNKHIHMSLLFHCGTVYSCAMRDLHILWATNLYILYTIHPSMLITKIFLVASLKSDIFVHFCMCLFIFTVWNLKERSYFIKILPVWRLLIQKVKLVLFIGVIF